jgi:FkbM family methyltransferase
LPYQERFARQPAPALRTKVRQISDQIATLASRQLARPPRIVDVGAQLLASEGHVYDPLKKFAPIAVIGFDPLEERIQERTSAESGQNVTLLPYAIGDGAEHTLHINNDDATSSLFPLNVAYNEPFEHLTWLRTVRTEIVATHTLDEVLSADPVDFLKLDIQGGELMVLRAAPETLKRTAVVHCEVEFSPIYEGQPLYPEIQQHLNANGFELIDLFVPHRYQHLGNWTIPTQDRLMWADAVFFRRTEDRGTLAMQALIAATVYRKPSFARHLLELAGGAKPEAQPAPSAA